MVTNTCYKLLENPNMSKAMSKLSRDSIYHLLGVMVKKYNHGLGRCDVNRMAFSLGIIPLTVMSSRTLARPLAIYYCTRFYST